MSRSFGIFILVACFLLTVEQSVQSNPPDEKTPIRTDFYGDPLPPGAIARLGTVRLRPGSSVSSLAFSPDSKMLASADWSSRIQLWDVASGRELRQIAEDQGGSRIAFAPDGMTLASAGVAEKAIQLWDVATGKEVWHFAGDPTDYFAFSPDGKILAGTTKDKAIRLWEVATGKELRQLDNQEGVYSLGWAADGQTLACGTENGKIRLWQIDTGKELSHLVGHRGRVSQITWDGIGKTLVSGGSDGTVRLWEVSTGKELRRLGEETGEQQRRRLKQKDTEELTPNLGHITGLVFSGDGKTIFAASQDSRRIWRWDLVSGEELAPLVGNQRVFCLAKSADGKLLASGGALHAIELWDLTTGKPIRPFAGLWGRPFDVVFSPDGKSLFSAGEDQTIHQWETSTWKQVRQFNGHQDSVYRLGLSADGKMLASSGYDGTVRLWNPADGKEVNQLGGSKFGWVRTLALAPDGKRMATLGAIWDTGTSKELLNFEKRKLFGFPAFSPDSKILACGPDENGYFRLFDSSTWNELKRFKVHSNIVYRPTFSPDGKFLALGTGIDSRKPDLSPDEKGTVQLWNVATGKLSRHFQGHRNSVYAVAFSPDGKTLASGSGDNWNRSDDTVRLWEVATGKERRCFRGHRNLVGSVAFSPDGKMLASTSEDTTVLIWDVADFSAAGQGAAGDLSPESLKSYWADLAGEDAAKAYRAICEFAHGSRKTEAFIQKRLRPIASADPNRIDKLIADLDSRQFEEREHATKELEKLGELASPALERALKNNAPVEVGRRVDRLLEKIAGPVTSPDLLQALRGIEVLEHMTTPEAREVLQTLAKGAPEARLTQEAKASLERLHQRMPRPEGAN